MTTPFPCIFYLWKMTRCEWISTGNREVDVSWQKQLSMMNELTLKNITIRIHWVLYPKKVKSYPLNKKIPSPKYNAETEIFEIY